MSRSGPGMNGEARMVRRYFQNRCSLGSAHSRFHCTPCCSRPGCSTLEMAVPVTIFDLIGVALCTHEPMERLCKENYVVGLLPREGFDWVKSVALKLVKPCPFLERQRCSIYEVRPLACMLFPEYQATTGALPSMSGDPVYKEYCCVHSPFSVTRERARALRCLAGMLQREVAISDNHLFGRSPLWIDFRALAEELIADSRSRVRQADEESTEIMDALPPQAFDRCLQKHLLPLDPLSGIENRVLELGREEVQQRMFDDLGDDGKVKKLLRRMQEDRPLVFEYQDHALKARRRSLGLREHMFL